MQLFSIFTPVFAPESAPLQPWCGFLLHENIKIIKLAQLPASVSYTLSHFGLNFLPVILSFLQVSQQAAKCIPAMVCPELTEQIRREVAASLHQRKGDFTCYFLTDLVTFTLPAGQHDKQICNCLKTGRPQSLEKH